MSHDASTVLVVDDDPEWRTLLRESLEREGFHVHEAASGDVAPEAVDRYHPDVVVLDHHMPGLNGLDLLTVLRGRWPRLPIVLTSAFGDRRIIERARRFGHTRYLDKPFHITTLLHEIVTLVGTRQPR